MNNQTERADRIRETLLPAWATIYRAEGRGEWEPVGQCPIRVDGSSAYVPLYAGVAPQDRLGVGGKIYDVLGTRPGARLMLHLDVRLRAVLGGNL